MHYIALARENDVFKEDALKSLMHNIFKLNVFFSLSEFKRQGQLPAFILLSFAALTIQSPLQNVPQSQPEYLISRDDVHNTLSQ